MSKKLREGVLRYCPALLVMLSSGLMAATVDAGTWTKLTNQDPAGGAGTMHLLTDGTVLVQGPNVTKRWDKLSPDAQGNYLNGTWSSVANMGLERLYFASHVLPDGRVFVLGGEYSGPQGNATWINSGEIYDPVANTWTPTPNFPQSQFGDDPSILLPNGLILCGYLSGPQTYLYNPSSNSWTTTGTKLRSDASDEETWFILPDGSVLSYDIFSSINTGTPTAQKYNYQTETWSNAGTLPALLSTPTQGYELGPGTQLPNGLVFQVGANENTALYNPSTNSWTAGPTLPTGFGSDDSPGVMLPTGNFLFMADRYLFNSPSKLFSYNYSTNSVTDVTPGGALGTFFANNASYYSRFLMLPNGQALFSAGGELWIYNPAGDGTIQNSWRPTVSSIIKNSATNFTLQGSQLTGISQGATYGDDAEMDTNYPIVRITNPSNGQVYYARSTGWTPGVSQGSSSFQFQLPAGFPTSGTFNLEVVANGIPSTAVPFDPFGSGGGGCLIARLIQYNKGWTPGKTIKLGQTESRTQLLDDLRLFRDRVLKQTPAGRELVDTYYAESTAIATAMFWNPSLGLEALELIAEVREATVIDGEAQTEVQLPAATMQRGLKWLDRLESLVSAESRGRLQSVRQTLLASMESHEGMVQVNFKDLKPVLLSTADKSVVRVPRSAELLMQDPAQVVWSSRAGRQSSLMDWTPVAHDVDWESAPIIQLDLLGTRKRSVSLTPLSLSDDSRRRRAIE